jgi:hypothetical protein
MIAEGLSKRCSRNSGPRATFFGDGFTGCHSKREAGQQSLAALLAGLEEICSCQKHVWAVWSIWRVSKLSCSVMVGIQYTDIQGRLLAQFFFLRGWLCLHQCSGLGHRFAGGQKPHLLNSSATLCFCHAIPDTHLVSRLETCSYHHYSYDYYSCRCDAQPLGGVPRAL